MAVYQLTQEDFMEDQHAEKQIPYAEVRFQNALNNQIDYTPIKPMKCKFCASNEIIFTIQAWADGRSGVKAYCKDCHKDNNWVTMDKNKNKNNNSAIARWANEVKIRDGRKCVICSSEDSIEAHHIIPLFHSDEFKYEIGNGITLCKKHHQQVHQSYFTWNNRRKDERL